MSGSAIKTGYLLQKFAGCFVEQKIEGTPMRLLFAAIFSVIFLAGCTSAPQVSEPVSPQGGVKVIPQ